MIMNILFTIFTIIIYCFAGFCTAKYLVERFMDRKQGHASKRRLKAEYFEKCGVIVKLIGTKEWDAAHDNFFEEIQEITNRMIDAGMGKIARQEFGNIKDLCKELGYHVESDKDE